MGIDQEHIRRESETPRQLSILDERQSPAGARGQKSYVFSEFLLRQLTAKFVVRRREVLQRSGSMKASEAREWLTSPPEGDFVAAVREVAKETRPWLSIAQAARLADISVRSLQRKLAAEDRVFSELVDGVRRELAGEMLEETTLSLSEIAAELGYATAASLTRAVRRWTGQTPAQVRRRTQHRPARKPTPTRARQMKSPQPAPAERPLGRYVSDAERAPTSKGELRSVHSWSASGRRAAPRYGPRGQQPNPSMLLVSEELT